MKPSNASQTITWNWRKYFTKSTLDLGQRDFLANKLREFTIGEDGKSASGVTENNFRVEVKSVPTTYAEYLDYPEWSDLSSGCSVNSSGHITSYYHCTCVQGSSGTRCRHLANLLLRWEHVRGGFSITETAEERRERLNREKAEMVRAKKEKQVVDVNAYFQNWPAPDRKLHFDPDRLMSKVRLKTNAYEIEQAQAMTADGGQVDMEIGFNQSGRQMLLLTGRFEGHVARMAMTADEIKSITCSCDRCSVQFYWYYGEGGNGKLCAHALALWKLGRERIVRENPGDATDVAATKLLDMMASGSASKAEEPSAPRTKKPGYISLQPRIVRTQNDSEAKLAFDISRLNSRPYLVRKLESLVQAVESDEAYRPTPKAEFNFGQETLDEASEKWYQLIAARVRAVRRLNQKIADYYGYGVRQVTAGDGIPLEDSELDAVYDNAEGGELLYQYGARNEAVPVRVGSARPKATVNINPVMDGKQLTGLRLTGSMPQLLNGSAHQYVLDRDGFGRVSTDEKLDDLLPFRAIDDGTGHFACVIGERKFPEFLYRVLPRLQNARQIILTDKTAGMLDGLVPPEPEFVFYIDCDEVLSCKTTVSYAGQTVPLGFPDDMASLARRDADQEKRVFAAVREYFPNLNPQLRRCEARNDDDTLVRILTDGVAALSAYGEVKGSDAFRNYHLRPLPQTRISLHVDGGLLDLSIETKDISEAEMLELLQSYRKKKLWHRLKSGDYIDLRDTMALDELVETVESMDVPIEKLITEGVKVPKYRALYVDKLLEAHDEIAASRDKRFKALIRSFQTIKDSDFEVSDSLTDVLRSYQVYGYRWLSTLGQSGFGGILADEMGLGKTLEMLAFLKAQVDGGEKRPSLVVCPASLVYNWKEECRKFTPELTVETLDGTLSQRKKLLQGVGEDGHALLYITSYDLMKRDITLYDGLNFATVALDEAQYIKNRNAAVSKAVRVLSAEHRFAMTGTPIENRLSELWSIFDFLMPGFLYNATEFTSRFEGPIMKQKDPVATARLARMTEPFILRRKKADVLKDLPEKLEETRAFAMEPDQRRLYDAQVVHMREMLSDSGDTAQDKMRILAEITRLRQLCCDPALLFEDYSGSSAKRAACLELVQNASDAGHRLLVFSQFTSMLDLLAQDLKNEGIPFYTITGSTPKQERLRLVNEFNGGDVPVFLISLKAGGTGLNLTGADVVVHYDPWWNLAVQNQATDRAHRIGQTRQVTVLRLIAAGTIEEKIVALQEAKRELAETIISSDSNSLMSFTREELLELLG